MYSSHSSSVVIFMSLPDILTVVIDLSLSMSFIYKGLFFRASRAYLTEYKSTLVIRTPDICSVFVRFLLYVVTCVC